MRSSAFLVGLGLLVIAGCSGSSNSPEATATSTPKTAPAAATPEKKPLKVALLTPGPVNDAGWSAMAYDGLQAIKEQTGAEVANEEASGETQIRDAMRTYAQKGFNLIFGHGYEYNAPGVALASDFPSTVFVSSSGDKTAKNAGAFRFELEQGFYLAGMMAGKMSKTGKVAMIGGDQVPSIQSTFDAFKAGVAEANPSVKVLQVYTGNGTDVAAAKAATEQTISQGADFVIHQANAAAQGVFEACKEKGVYAFGANADQNSNPTGIVIASAVIVAKPAFLELAKEVQDGTFTGSVRKFGMKDGAIDFVLNPSLKGKVPGDVQKLLDDTKGKIMKGEVQVPEATF